MAYVATQSLQWGDDTIPAGALVPDDEPGRDYGLMVHLGQIREVDDTAGLSDDVVRAELKKVTAERDALQAQLDAAEEDGEPVVVPDGVVPGETPGWPLVVLPLTDVQRELLAEAEISGTVTLDELRAAIDTLVEAKAEESAGEGDGDQGDGDELPEGVVETSPGWFQVPGSDRSVRRRDIAAALAEAKG